MPFIMSHSFSIDVICRETANSWVWLWAWGPWKMICKDVEVNDMYTPQTTDASWISKWTHFGDVWKVLTSNRKASNKRSEMGDIPPCLTRLAITYMENVLECHELHEQRMVKKTFTMSMKIKEKPWKKELSGQKVSESYHSLSFSPSVWFVMVTTYRFSMLLTFILFYDRVPSSWWSWSALAGADWLLYSVIWVSINCSLVCFFQIEIEFS